MIRSPETLDKFGAAGQKKVREKLTWEAKANQIAAVYEAVLKGEKILQSLDYR
jgi:glycosyltransferase involved in cell wall biosynthesis